MSQPRTVSELAREAEQSLSDWNEDAIAVHLKQLKALKTSGQKCLDKKRYDEAFVALVQHQKLATDWLPNRHSLYYNIPEETIVNLAKDSEKIATKLSSLRRIIYERHERWITESRTAQPIASTSSLVTSASFETSTDASSRVSTSMDLSSSSRRKLERASTTLDSPKKEGLVQRLKRTLGKSKAKAKVKEEKPEDWTVVSSEKATEDSEKLAPISRTSTGILYASTGSAASSSTWQTDLTSLTRPRSQASINSAQSTAPSLAQSTTNSPTVAHPESLRPRLGPSQAESLRLRSSQPSLGSSSAVSTPAAVPTRVGTLVRTQSRLTTAHQQSQGYFPSPVSTPTSFSRRSSSTATPSQPQRANSALTSYFPLLPLATASSQPSVPTYTASPISTTFLPPLPERPQAIIRNDTVVPPTNSSKLRRMIVPTEIISMFVAMAMDNTEHGIETCGLILGVLREDEFIVTDLLLPQQTGTPDTCTSTHEEETLLYQTNKNLLTLGWIHSHPTQSCFLSSLDLHTHAGYQVMLPEAIAIVCSPRFEPSFNVFRLLDPPGLQTIMTCTEQGAFHPHPEGAAIYTDCDEGHVELTNGLRLEICDLRN